MSKKPATVDFFADVSCPWCYVAWEALKRAAETRPDRALTVAWRTFLLSPELPPEGLDREAFYQMRFGDDRSRLQASRAALTKLAGEARAPMDLDAAKLIPNTIDAHRVIHWAAGEGVAEGLIDMVFAAYFVHGRDIGAAETLVDIAGKVGLDTGRVERLLEGDTDRDLVLGLHAAAARVGVTGVPVAIFDRAAALVGAQSPGVYGQALDGTLSTTAH
jgi:predicted DsbA family dithiol-disulfide isomerase